MYQVGPDGEEEELTGFGGVNIVAGGTWPTRVWTDYMSVALEGVEVEDFPEPDIKTPTRTPSPTPEPTTPTPTPTPTPTEEPTPTPTPTPEPTPEPTKDPGPPEPTEGPAPTEEPTAPGNSGGRAAAPSTRRRGGDLTRVAGITDPAWRGRDRVR